MVVIAKTTTEYTRGVRAVDVYDQKKLKLKIRPIAGRMQLIVVDNYGGHFDQQMVNECFSDDLAILDSRTRRSIVVDTDDVDKVIGIAKNIAKRI